MGKILRLAFILVATAVAGGCATPMMRSPAGDGPGAGGGTDLVHVKGSKVPVLADFAKTWNQESKDPRTYGGIYARLQPKLERLDYYYPGIKTELEKTFAKDWILTDEVFKPNR